MEEKKKVTKSTTNKKGTSNNTKKSTTTKKTTNSKKSTAAKKNTTKKTTSSKNNINKKIEKIEKIDTIISDIDKEDNEKTQMIDLVVSDNKINKEVKEDNNDSAFNKKGKRKRFFNGKFYLDILDILIIILFTALVSCVTCGMILNYQYRKNNIIYSNNLKEDEGLSEFIRLYSDILDNYIEDVDSNELIEAAINGMLDHLEDKYSIYFDRGSSEEYDDYLNGKYTGIGILASENTVIEVYDNSPAKEAGIEPGDVIVKINGTEINKDNYALISTLINEKDGDSEVVVKRDKKELTFTIKPDVVTLNMTTHKVINKSGKKIGYLSLSKFSNISHEQFAEALIDLEKDNIDSLIIDLRGNSGGYLTSMESIANLFVEKGKVLYSLQSKDETKETKSTTDDKREYPIVVLVNEKSASASEMLAACLKESYGATLVGKTTYGKGTAQNVVHSGNSSYKYTAYKWLTPNGDCIDGEGIKPDYEVDNTMDGNILYDKQLDKALEVLTK